MIRIKTILIGLLGTVFLCSCGDDNNSSNFDSKAQANKDSELLVNFLKNHYYDTAVDSVKPLISGKTALFDDAKLKKQAVTENDIDYTLYYYQDSVGTVNSPSVVDSVLVSYYGQRIINADSISKTSFDSNRYTWLNLGGTIKGWSYAFPNFKTGRNVTTNGPITYINGGKGVLFIPSGLAYGNRQQGSIQQNENLLFYIDLHDYVYETDGDLDGIPSILEDLDGNGNPWDDDTDKDNIPNFRDTDDDGDGVLTKFEDANKDGDPRNDFSDSNNPTTPDYLNFKWRKSNQ